MLNKKIIITLCLFFPSFSHAIDVSEDGAVHIVDEQGKPTQSIKIFNRVNVASEYSVIRYFFTYTCEYGYKYDEDMAIWGSSLPKGFHYTRVPVITQEPNSMVGAFAYYSAIVADKTKINKFQHEVYTLIKIKGADPSSQLTYLKGAIRAGYNENNYKKAWGSELTRKLVENSAILSSKYNIKYTPTLTVGGIYTLTPEPIAESRTSFVDFANGITSKYISENKAAIK